MPQFQRRGDSPLSQKRQQESEYHHRPPGLFSPWYAQPNRSFRPPWNSIINAWGYRYRTLHNEAERPPSPAPLQMKTTQPELAAS